MVVRARHGSDRLGADLRATDRGNGAGGGAGDRGVAQVHCVEKKHIAYARKYKPSIVVFFFVFMVLCQSLNCLRKSEVTCMSRVTCKIIGTSDSQSSIFLMTLFICSEILIIYNQSTYLNKDFNS